MTCGWWITGIVLLGGIAGCGRTARGDDGKDEIPAATVGGSRHGAGRTGAAGHARRDRRRPGA